jgi:hypothetical protein
MRIAGKGKPGRGREAPPGRASRLRDRAPNRSNSNSNPHRSKSSYNSFLFRLPIKLGANRPAFGATDVPADRCYPLGYCRPAEVKLTGGVAGLALGPVFRCARRFLNLVHGFLVAGFWPESTDLIFGRNSVPPHFALASSSSSSQTSFAPGGGQMIPVFFFKAFRMIGGTSPAALGSSGAAVKLPAATSLACFRLSCLCARIVPMTTGPPKTPNTPSPMIIIT